MPLRFRDDAAYAITLPLITCHYDIYYALPLADVATLLRHTP